MRYFTIGSYTARLGYVEDNYWSGQRLDKPMQFVYWRIEDKSGNKVASGRTLDASIAIELSTHTIRILQDRDKQNSNKDRATVLGEQLVLL